MFYLRKNLMTTRSTILLRVLAVATTFEAVAGLYEIALTLFVYSYPWKYLVYEDPRAKPFFYTMLVANVIFIALLVVSAVFLWVVRKTGLAVLTWTLCAEVAYAASILVSGTLSGLAFQSPSQKIDVGIWGAASVGNGALIAQVWTAYPLVGAVLIFFGYRSLRSTGPSIEARSGERAAHGFATIMRVLAVTCLLEAVSGLLVLVSGVASFPYLAGRLGLQGPHMRSIFYSSASVNMILMLLLVISAVLLWKLERKGLIFLTWILGIEILYFIGTSVISYIERTDLSLSTVMGLGDACLGVQIWTAYPLVAAVLIFLAYRSQRMPARKMK
jgi:hypothetical protein